MPRYLIEISAPPAAAEQILQQPRAYLDGIRAVTTELGAQLNDCWFTEDGEKLIAVMHAPEYPEHSALRRAFTRVWEGIDVEVHVLLTLRELTYRARGEDVLLRTELWSDPVDLGSDLSFPASDPPGWMSRAPVTYE